MKRLKQLAKDSLVYGLGGILARGVSFFLIPVYTNIFSLSEYGSIEMLVIITNFFVAVLAMGMDSAQSMFFFKLKKKGKVAQAQIVSAIFQWRIIWGIVIVIIVTLIAPILNGWFFNGQLSFKYFVIAFIGAFFVQIMSQSTEVMRLLYRPFSYTGIILGQSILVGILILIIEVLFDLGIFSFFIGIGIASIVFTIIGWYHVRDYLCFDRVYWSLWPQLIRFGAPLVPAELTFYLMSSSDRWFVQYYHGSGALGVFAIGAKFSMLLALVVETFRKAWWPIGLESMHSKDGPETFRMIAILYMSIAIIGIIILTVISPWLVKWMTPPEFYDAWPIIGILAWQSLFYGFFLISSAGIWKSEKMHLNFYLMCVAALVGLLLNWLLVPVFGGTGAAIATAITYFFWVLISMMVSETLWRVGFSWTVLVFQISLGAIFVTWFINDNNKSNFIFVAVIAILVIFLQFIIIKKFTKIKIRNLI
jgi:O-antigen/teichoic acid export membrane protein